MAELFDAAGDGEIEGNQGGGRTRGTHRVIDLFKPALEAIDQDQLRALDGESLGDGRAEPARGAGYEREAPVKLPGHGSGEFGQQ